MDVDSFKILRHIIDKEYITVKSFPLATDKDLLAKLKKISDILYWVDQTQT